jgi:urease accessory protein
MMTQLAETGSSGAPRLQRARGGAHVALRGADGAVRLERLSEQGAAKIRLTSAGPARDVVMVNTAGGLAEGDRLDWSLELDGGARVTATTQACEKVYRSLAGGEPARTTARLRIGEGCRLDWLPQEAILFDRARLSRTLEADISADGELLAVEAVILGRRAMGEAVSEASLTDRWRVRRSGRLIFAEELSLAGPVGQLAARPALLGGAGAYASVLLVADDAAEWLEAVRSLLPDTAGASAFEGKLFCRLLARDGFHLRHALIPLLTLLRGGSALPRLWTV